MQDHSDGAILFQGQVKDRRAHPGCGQGTWRRIWDKIARPVTGFTIDAAPGIEPVLSVARHRISPVSVLEFQRQSGSRMGSGWSKDAL